MAERPENQRVVELLARLDGELLREAACWFAGGAAISLRCGEFRLSRDVDLLCSSREGYRALRQRVFEGGVEGLFATPVEVVREARVDRYGIRAAFAIDGVVVKFEIVSEARVDLEGVDDPVLPVARLCDVDLVTEKLLANADRFLDDASMGRDAIDLVMLEHTLGGLPEAARVRARAAYGPSIDQAYDRALVRLRDRPAHTERFLEAMQVLPGARAIVWAALAAVSPRGGEG